MSCPSDNDLAQLVDGSLPGAVREVVEHHLDCCDVCTGLVAELAWVVGGHPAAPPGYRFVREIARDVFEAIGPDNVPVIVESGVCDTTLARVRHPAVATIVEIGDRFVAYELLQTTLREWVVDQPFERRWAAWLAVLHGLAAIHRNGSVHGRVSPDHVFIDGERVVIAGFARTLPRTAGYLAPDVLSGAPATAKSDQFSACVGLYEAMTGARPFRGATAGALSVAMASPPPPPRALQRGHASALLRGLSFDPAARWPDVSLLVAALERTRNQRYLVMMAGLIVIAVIYMLLNQHC